MTTGGTKKRRPKRPEVIELVPFKYQLVWTKSKGASSHGETNPDLKEIVVNDIGTPESIAETSVHEVCHVLVEDLIHVIMNYDGKEDEADELFTRLFSPRLYYFLKNNKEFIDYVQQAR